MALIKHTTEGDIYLVLNLTDEGLVISGIERNEDRAHDIADANSGSYVLKCREIQRKKID
jgi:hypothetical protein